MAVCTGCGRDLAEGASFCTECGQRREVATTIKNAEATPDTVTSKYEYKSLLWPRRDWGGFHQEKFRNWKGS